MELNKARAAYAASLTAYDVAHLAYVTAHKEREAARNELARLLVESRGLKPGMVIVTDKGVRFRVELFAPAYDSLTNIRAYGRRLDKNGNPTPAALRTEVWRNWTSEDGRHTSADLTFTAAEITGDVTK